MQRHVFLSPSAEDHSSDGQSAGFPDGSGARQKCNARRSARPAFSSWSAPAAALAWTLTGCDGIPRVNVETSDELVTGEDGSKVELAISLTQPPHGVISVDAISSNESEGRVSEPVRFDARNWHERQIIQVTGQNDSVDDGDVAYDVTLYATNSRHVNAHPVRIKVLHFVNRDDEIARFEALGDLPGGEYASYVADVSSSGDVVAGWSVGADGEEAVRWTPSAGLEGLGGAPSQAHSVSPNGMLLSGWVEDAAYYQGLHAALWSEPGAYRLLEGPSGPTQYNFWLIDGAVVLDDGRVFSTCVQKNAYNVPLGCRVDGPEQLTPLLSQVFAADADNHYAGRTNGNRSDPFVRMTFDETVLPYPTQACRTPSWDCRGEARSFSADRSVIVGTSRIPAPDVDPYGSPTPLFDTAWVKTQADVLERLPDIEGAEQRSGAYAVSSDGRIIAGFGTDELGSQAVVWIEGAPILLADLLADQGGELPRGFILREIRAMSANARTFVGNGTNAEGSPEGFRVVLASAP